MVTQFLIMIPTVILTIPMEAEAVAMIPTIILYWMIMVYPPGINIRIHSGI
jgi:hypothetical protein